MKSCQQFQGTIKAPCESMTQSTDSPVCGFDPLKEALVLMWIKVIGDKIPDLCVKLPCIIFVYRENVYVPRRENVH
jgi:hypothetical protein